MSRNAQGKLQACYEDRNAQSAPSSNAPLSSAKQTDSVASAAKTSTSPTGCVNLSASPTGCSSLQSKNVAAGRQTAP